MNNEQDSQTNNPFSSDDEFSDSLLICIDCEQDFVWTAGEQTFFRDKGLKNPPKRCKPCKQAKNQRLAAVNDPSSGRREKIEVLVNCAKCEKSTTVPFYPSQGRPVLCRSCFIEQNPDILNPNL